MFSCNVTLAFYLSSSESSLAGVLWVMDIMEMGSECCNKEWNCRTIPGNYPPNAQRGNSWFTANYTASSQPRSSARRGCRQKFISSETNIIASIIVYPPRSILEICLCTYFQLLVHCSITNSKRIQLLSAICDFSPILKFNADHKFGRIYMYCLLFGKTSVQDSEIQKYSMLHT